MDHGNVDQQLTDIAGLGDRLRRALYRYVAECGVPVSRDDAAAAALGAELATEATNHTAAQVDRADVLAALRQTLASRGYEPYDDSDGTIRLRNCPFDRIAAQHRELVCGANLAMLQRLADQLGGDQPVRALLDPRPGRCCVALTRDS